MINEPVAYDKSPKEIHINSNFRKVAQNASYGCRRTKSAGYYDETADKTFLLLERRRYGRLGWGVRP